MATGIGHDRNAAAAGGDHDQPGIDQGADRRFLHNTQRRRRGHQSPPTSPGIVAAIPTVDFDASPGIGLIHEGADRLGRVPEGRIAGADFHLSHDRGHCPVDAKVEKVVVQALLEGIADGPLRVRTANIEGHFV